MKVLIAEDNAPSALYLRRTLESLGHQVIVTLDGEQAWEVIQKERVPLLISDWMMPRMDGLELCRRIRGRVGCDYTYIILLTLKHLREERLEGLRAGADDFITKPPHPDELAIRMEIAGRILGVQEALARQNARLAELATTDDLTGLKNRRRFHEDLNVFFSLSARRSEPLSLVMIDLDQFKAYNDSFGHPAGDLILSALAEILRENIREHDVAARYGGEEFVVLLPSTDAHEANALAERLRERIENRGWPLRGVTASLGVATSGPTIASIEALIEAADQALYLAKRKGRNRVCRYDPTVEGTPHAGTRRPVGPWIG